MYNRPLPMPLPIDQDELSSSEISPESSPLLSSNESTPDTSNYCQKISLNVLKPTNHIRNIKFGKKDSIKFSITDVSMTLFHTPEKGDKAPRPILEPTLPTNGRG